MRVRYITLSSEWRETKKGGYLRDVVLDFGDERVYCILYSDIPVSLEDEGIIDVDLSRALRGKVVAIKMDRDLTKDVLSDIIKNKLNKEV